MFEHLSGDKKRVNVRDFGAIGDGVANDTAAVRAAASSLTDGGIVYFPAGIYLIDFVPFYEGVTYLLEGKVDDVTKGFTDDLRERIESGKEFAVVRSTGKSDIFINHEMGEFASDNAASNYGLSGGVVDGIGRVRHFIFIHCENVLLENCIVLDSPNNHAIQVTGAKNVMIRNCMFAGYNFRGNLYAETIQIEQSHPGAIGWQLFTSSNVNVGEYRFSENVTVEGCYFGKSDKFGAPLIPIGHHGMEYKSSVTGCYIHGCVFDNPLYMALRPYAYSNLVVENNTFISTEEKVVEPSDALITYVLGKPNSKAVVFDEAGHYIQGFFEPSYASEGSICTKIRNNKFVIKGNRQPRILNAVGIYKPGMKVTTHMVKIDEFGGKPYPFHGYKTVRDMIYDLEFVGNDITILDTKPAVTDYLMRFEKVYDLKIADNKITSNVESYTNWYRANEAVKLVESTSGTEGKTRIIEGDGACGRRVILPLGDGEVCRAHCACRLDITLYTQPEGRIETSTDENGNGVITVLPNEGYRFVGWRAVDAESPLAAGDVELSAPIALIAEYAK